MVSVREFLKLSRTKNQGDDDDDDDDDVDDDDDDDAVFCLPFLKPQG